MTTVLVVDDETAIADLLRAVLTRDGHQVVTASDRHGALEVAASTPLDLVVADLNLGGEDGLDLLDELSAAQPGLRSILMTGYAPPEAATRCTLVLEKPFTLASAASAVAEALDRDGIR